MNLLLSVLDLFCISKEYFVIAAAAINCLYGGRKASPLLQYSARIIHIIEFIGLLGLLGLYII